ncbi:MAG TPA: aminotransferase class IV [Solirubrobacterales bacterium]|nr:aminotransferase class IV [Candidatus Dormibacteraeota bacterium]HVC08080.1 aminotransferase class IV [Solirubrobacterales bacterium]
MPPIPDRKKGVFETMLVVDGHPVELDAHLERISSSLRALFGSGAPPSAVQLVSERARCIGLGRLRLTIAPDGDGALQGEVVTAQMAPAMVFPAPQRALALRSHLLEGGLGAHKWADRRLLEAAEAATPADSAPLLVDHDAVLEASRANVFAVRGGALLTPPADGRILPGIARARAIEVAAQVGIEVREEAIGLAALAGADEVFLTGSLRGVEPVCALDGAILPAGELSGQIAAGLRRHWLGASEPGAAPEPSTGPPPGRPAR